MKVYVVYTWLEDYYTYEDAENCEVYDNYKAASDRVAQWKRGNTSNARGIEIVEKEVRSGHVLA